MSTAIWQGISQKLLATSGVTDKVGTRVYHMQAPPSATYPLIIVSKAARSKTRAMGANAFDRNVWLVKTIDRNTSSTNAEAIAKAIDDTLDLGTITVAGANLADLHHVSDVSYVEPSGDQQYRHHGANYRVVLT